MMAIERKTVKQQQNALNSYPSYSFKIHAVLKQGQKKLEKKNSKQVAGSFRKPTDNRAPALPHEVYLGSVK